MPFKLKSYLESARRGLRSTLYWAPGGYRAEQYWKRRHLRYRFDLRGVGNCGLSHDENAVEYRRATDVFLAHCRELGVDFGRARALDIGCGTGHYAQVFRGAGGTRYLGIDITDALFDELRREYPGFEFRKHDITQHPLNETYDLIIMIDVTQHITDAQKFSRALGHVRASLTPAGRFVVTSWLDASARRSFYEVSRTMDDYRRAFPDDTFSAPVNYRDKFLFSIRKASHA